MKKAFIGFHFLVKVIFEVEEVGAFNINSTQPDQGKSLFTEK